MPSDYHAGLRSFSMSECFRSVELFTGAGGLALGVSRAGFRHEALVEVDPHACHTIRHNQSLGVWPAVDWPLVQRDVRQIDFAALAKDVDLLAGGPPCQPFSLGGKHAGHSDRRNMFPEAARAVRELCPRAFLFENVRGLVRPSFAHYYAYIVLQVTYPEISRGADESWREHLARLERYHTHGKRDGLYYRVVWRVLNAADYGVPQRRERVFIVGFRADQGFEWTFPDATHAMDALLADQYVTGDYWGRHGLPRPPTPDRWVSRVRKLRRQPAFLPFVEPWVTTREALAGLPDPERERDAARRVPNHEHVPGARTYAGHTGSPLDEPAKTLKAGDHGVPGGENMLAYPDGRVRYLTVRESARLQEFPDTFVFDGTRTESMRQLGNAVPVRLGFVLAHDIARRLTRQ